MVRHTLASSPTHATTLREYLQVLRRRKLLVAIAVIVVPVAAFVLSHSQRPEYQGTAQVLLSQQDLGAELTGTAQYTNDPADRQAQTQASLARVPAVAQMAVAASHSNLSAQGLLSSSSVSPGANADLLTFAVTSPSQEAAQVLATAYARAYVRYRLAVDTGPIKAALHEVESQVAQLSSRGALYTSLQEKATQLRTLAALKTANASVVQTGGGVVQTAPRTKRNVVLGALLGVLLGIGLAFLWEALDTRVRSAETVGEHLHLPLLARLPAPPKSVRNVNHLVMIDEPSGIHAEAFRMLRTNIEFASLGKEARKVMVTSAMEQEGKSTTVANLAVAFAKAGQHVVLVDLDLRRPFVERFFQLEGRPGITQVAIGAAALGEAIVRIPVVRDDGLTLAASQPNGNGHGHARSRLGALDVLPSGPIPPDPGEFVGAARLTEILEHLSNHCDVVLVDAPPLFHVGDAMTLSAKIDSVLVVTNLKAIRRPMLTELRRQLDTMPANKLGFIVTGAEAEESYGYGYGYGSYHHHYYRTEERSSALTDA